MATEAVSVTLPADDLERVRTLVRAGAVRSVSSYLADALHSHLNRQQRSERAVVLVHELFGNPDDLSADDRATVEARINGLQETSAAYASRAGAAAPTAAP
jgi:Arc/MetJ-type ribon-helix-helix transcriptional regulator